VFKVCPRCGDEYQLTMSRCRDCDVDLVLPGAETIERLLPDEELELVTTDSPWALEEIAEQLSAHGIPSRIDSHPRDAAISAPSWRRKEGAMGFGIRLGIYVRLRDLTTADRVARDHLRSRMPELPEAASEAAEPRDACPACDAPLTGAAEACASCGLEFQVAEVTCLACGHETESDRADCPSCGRPLDGGPD
jgi:uncharacterized protein with PIN domain